MGLASTAVEQEIKNVDPSSRGIFCFIFL